MQPDRRSELVQKAKQARQLAYAPYSGYRVGAALLTKSGEIYTGANIENASYGLTMCAERNAAFQAAANEDREFVAIAIVTENRGTPCGACLQVLSEFGNGMAIVLAESNSDEGRELTLDQMLPNPFRPEDLPSG